MWVAPVIKLVATLAACALTNRFCGIKIVPFKPLLIGAPLIGLVASFWFQPNYAFEHPLVSYWVAAYLPAKVAHLYFVASAYRISIGFALAFFFWRVWEWGRWIDLGSLPDDHNREGVEPTILERVITKISLGSDLISLFWRHALLLPALAILSFFGGPSELVWLSIAAAAAFAAIYQAAKFINPKNYVWLAELGVGLVWGLFVAYPTFFKGVA